jgi:tRNA(fMet)-specific endonuclease VapC
LKYLIDTNSIIYAFKDAGNVRQCWASVPVDEIVLCSVCIFELEFGLAKSSSPTAFRQFLSGIRERHRTLNFDDTAALRAGQVRAVLSAGGSPIGPFDLLIAGIALAHNLTLVTRNTREFTRVPGLKLENWYGQSRL